MRENEAEGSEHAINFWHAQYHFSLIDLELTEVFPIQVMESTAEISVKVRDIEKSSYAVPFVITVKCLCYRLSAGAAIRRAIRK